MADDFGIERVHIVNDATLQHVRSVVQAGQAQMGLYQQPPAVAPSLASGSSIQSVTSAASNTSQVPSVGGGMPR